MKNTIRRWTMTAAALAAGCGLAMAQEAALEKGQTITQDFEGELDARWKLKAAEVSEEQAHGGTKSLKVKGQAELVFSPGKELPVRIRLWVWDAGEQFSANAMSHAWGVSTEKGFQFAVRTVWRSYMDGNKVYAWFNTENNKWFTPKNTRVPRKQGWSEWVFDFTNPDAVTVAGNGQKVALEAQWTPKGAVSVFLLGGKDGGDFFVDDITVEYP